MQVYTPTRGIPSGQPASSQWPSRMDSRLLANIRRSRCKARTRLIKSHRKHQTHRSLFTCSTITIEKTRSLCASCLRPSLPTGIRLPVALLMFMFKSMRRGASRKEYTQPATWHAQSCAGQSSRSLRRASELLLQPHLIKFAEGLIYHPIYHPPWLSRKLSHRLQFSFLPSHQLLPRTVREACWAFSAPAHSALARSLKSVRVANPAAGSTKSRAKGLADSNAKPPSRQAPSPCPGRRHKRRNSSMKHPDVLKRIEAHAAGRE